MNPTIKTRIQSSLNAVFILATGMTFLFAFLSGFQFDVVALGYFMLIIASPVLVLLASDLRKLKKA